MATLRLECCAVGDSRFNWYTAEGGAARGGGEEAENDDGLHN